MTPAVRPDAPAVLAENGEAWGRSYAEKCARGSKDFDWKERDGVRVSILILDVLRAMTHEHCAYCDGRLRETSPETIDHFLPKAKYPELVYTWENLYPACSLCQGLKSVRFDRRIVRDEYGDELLRPDEPGYTFERYFILNYDSSEITIEPNPDARDRDRARAAFTIRALGLNEGGRPRSRKRVFEAFARWQRPPDVTEWSYRFALVDLT